MTVYPAGQPQVSSKNRRYQASFSRARQRAQSFTFQEAVRAAACEGEGGLQIVYASNLARRVLSSFKPFKTWRDGAIKRLCSVAKRDYDETLGDVVPREFFDADEDFAPAEREALVRRFMRGLSPKRNPWLHTAEELKQLHFDGPLFDFDEAVDRETRELG